MTAIESPLPCLILAGGLGTRLRSVVTDVPKPLASVAGKPFLEVVVKQARAAGVREIILCVAYKAEAIRQHFGDGEEFEVEIRYSVEEELLGTGGAVKLAAEMVTAERFWLINGDSFCGVDFAAMREFHADHRARVTLAAPLVEDRERFGSLLLGEDNAILRFGEKGESGPGRINGGVYLLNRDVLDLIPAGEVVSLEKEVLTPMCGQGLYAFKTDLDFIDIGLPEEWRRAQHLDFLR